MEDREKISSEPNEDPVNATFPSSGPGIPDHALGQRAQLPDPPSDEEVERIARKLGAPFVLGSHTQP